MLFFDPVLPPRVGQHGPLPSRVLFRRGKMSGVLEESCPHLCGAASSIPFASLPIPRADKMDSPSPHWALRMPLWGCALQDRPAPACGSEHSQLKLTQATLFTKLNIYSRFPFLTVLSMFIKSAAWGHQKYHGPDSSASMIQTTPYVPPLYKNQHREFSPGVHGLPWPLCLPTCS